MITRTLLAGVGIALAVVGLCVVLALWALSHAVTFLQFEVHEDDQG